MARLVCPNCGASFTLTDGARQGLRCSMCDGVLIIDEAPVAASSPTTQTADIPLGGERVAEIALPAHNEADVPAVRQFLSALSLPISLEYYGDSQRRVLLLRGSEPVLSAAAGQLAACWPSAVLRMLAEDPTQGVASGPHTRAYQLVQAEAEYLPLRTWDTFALGDPVQAVLGILAGLSAGEVLWIQIGLHERVQPEWLERIQRRVKLESQRGFLLAGDPQPGTPIAAHPTELRLRVLSILFQTIVILLAIGIVMAGLLGQWLLAGLGALLALSVGLLWQVLERRERAWERTDLAQARTKVVEQSAFLSVSLRAVLRAEDETRAQVLRERLEALLSQYSLAGGNRLVAQPVTKLEKWDAVPARERLALNVDELAGLWHLPRVAGAPVPGLTPTSIVETRAPDPREVQGFFRIGAYRRADGSLGEVQISARALRRNMALFGKPGTGKSTLMATLALAALVHPDHPAVVVVDAHGDLAQALIGILPADAVERVRLLDAGDETYLLTLNPLDAHRAGVTPETAARLVVDVGRALWGEYWGPRMQIPLSRAVQALAAANAHRAPDDQYGLALLSTLVNCRHELRQAFLEQEVGDDPAVREVRRYFAGDFHQLSPTMREQIIQPVLSKAYRFRETPLLPLLSCPQAVLDLGQVLAERRLLILNTSPAHIGTEEADFLGSLLLNLLLRQLVQQGREAPEQRVPLVVIVDEFQTYSGVPWAEWEQQVRKWGGSVVLGTQSLATLRAAGGAELPGIITSGTGSLFAFAVNGEDAAYLARNELGQNAGGPRPEALASLPPYQCYARLVGADGAPTRPFTLLTDPPRVFQKDVAEQVLAARGTYAIPYPEALARAREMLDALDIYAPSATVTSHGSVSSPRSAAVEMSSALAGEPAQGEPAAMPGLGAEDSEALADAVARDLSQFFPQGFGEDFGENPAGSGGREEDDPRH